LSEEVVTPPIGVRDEAKQVIDETHDFDLLNRWAQLPDGELARLATKDAIIVLRRVVDLLADKTQNRTEVSEDSFVETVRAMRELYRRGSRVLGEAIIEAAAYVKQGDFAQAKAIYERFIALCPSAFYTKIAKYHLQRIRN
jgi:tetratricopeptide (TPR) repeat protein